MAEKPGMKAVHRLPVRPGRSWPVGVECDLTRWGEIISFETHTPPYGTPLGAGAPNLGGSNASSTGSGVRMTGSRRFQDGYRTQVRRPQWLDTCVITGSSKENTP
jgi:hypothetical protein